MTDDKSLRFHRDRLIAAVASGGGLEYQRSRGRWFERESRARLSICFAKSRLLLSPKSRAPMAKPDPHQRTRRDHALETAEDYVEAVAEFIDSKGNCRVGDLAGFFGVSHVTVSRIVGRLVGEGLLKTEPYRPITLTAKGKKLAEKSWKRHQIVHEFLLALGVDEATAALDTEGIEHHVSPKTLEKLQALTRRLNDEI